MSDGEPLKAELDTKETEHQHMSTEEIDSLLDKCILQAVHMNVKGCWACHCSTSSLGLIKFFLRTRLTGNDGSLKRIVLKCIFRASKLFVMVKLEKV